MKIVQIKIIKKSISLILEDFIKELINLNEPTEIHLITNLKWGVTRIRNKSGNFRDSVKKSKGSSEDNMQKLDKILTLLKTGNHKLIDDYVDEKPKKEFKEKAKKEFKEKPKKEKWYAVKIGKNNIQDMIYKTWEECKEVTDGYDSVFKSFDTKEDAEKYLDTVDVEKVLKQKAYAIERKNKEKLSKDINIKLNQDMYQELLKKSQESKVDIENLIKIAISEYIYQNKN